MKLSKPVAAFAAVSLAFALTACGSDDSGKSTTTSKAATSAPATAATALPTAEELNAVLATTTDPNAPVDAKIKAVQGGETAPELFETMTRAKNESGANFQVVTPVLPGYTPNSVLATVNFTLPDRPSQVADNVEFINEGGSWKLSQSWACTLITNTVTPDQVPAMCHSETPLQTPAAQ